MIFIGKGYHLSEITLSRIMDRNPQGYREWEEKYQSNLRYIDDDGDCNDMFFGFVLRASYGFVKIGRAYEYEGKQETYLTQESYRQLEKGVKELRALIGLSDEELYRDIIKETQYPNFYAFKEF